MPKRPDGYMTGRQQAFVREYLIDCNADAAARRAGYTTRTARDASVRIMKIPVVAAAIKEAMDARAKRTEITADRVLQELAKIGFSDIRDVMTWDEESSRFVPSKDLGDDAAAIVSGVKSKTRTTRNSEGDSETTVELEIKTYDKVQALTQIGRHLGMFLDKTDITSGGEPIKIQVVYADPDPHTAETARGPAADQD